MDESFVERIRPGAEVEAADGHLGEVVRLEPAAAPRSGRIEVRVEGAERRLLVPPDFVCGVDADGTVRLSAARADLERLAPSEARTLELAEEELVARKELEEAGRIRVRKEVEEVPRRLEVEAYHEEVAVERIPIGRIVTERETTREEDGVLVVPIYEEQLVAVKRLVLKEEIRVRRRGATEKRRFEETVRRERLVIEDPDRTGRVREHYPTELPVGERVAGDATPDEAGASPEEGGLLERLGRKVLE